MKNFSFKMWSKGLALCLVCVMALSGCGNKVQNTEEVVSRDSISHDTLYSFMGKPIVINDSICEQIAAIAVQDSMLSCCDSIIRIGDVRWRINLHAQSIALITSVDFDAPQMKKVVEYLNTKYGMPYEDEDCDMKWSSSPDPNEPFMGNCTLIHLRPLHSEVGGTVLFVN